MKTLIAAILLCVLAGCATKPDPDAPSKDWQKDLQKAIDKQKAKQN